MPGHREGDCDQARPARAVLLRMPAAETRLQPRTRTPSHRVPRADHHRRVTSRQPDPPLQSVARRRCRPRGPVLHSPNFHSGAAGRLARSVPVPLALAAGRGPPSHPGRHGAGWPGAGPGKQARPGRGGGPVQFSRSLRAFRVPQGPHTGTTSRTTAAAAPDPPARLGARPGTRIPGESACHGRRLPSRPPCRPHSPLSEFSRFAGT